MTTKITECTSYSDATDCLPDLFSHPWFGMCDIICGWNPYFGLKDQWPIFLKPVETQSWKYVKWHEGSN